MTDQLLCDKEQTCSFSGHRQLPTRELPRLRARLKQEIVELIDSGVTCFLAGGARGFDMLAAHTVLELQAQFPQIRLTLALPCPEQDRGWSAADRRQYRELLAAADAVIYTADAYYQGCMQTRNRFLIDHSCCCICYLTRSRGGTAYTAAYAEKRGVKLIRLADPA